MANGGANNGENGTPASVIAKRIVIGVLVLYLVALVALNKEAVEVNFVFFKAQSSLVVVLILAGVLGAFIGWGIGVLRRRK